MRSCNFRGMGFALCLCNTKAKLAINRTVNKNLEVIMRKCVRCNIAMVENCGIKVKGAAYGLVLTDDENKWWGGRMEQPKVAICPQCGEVSIYLENVDKLKNK